MRSEKDIRKIMETKESVREALGLERLPSDYEMSIFKWVLTGEPRYSVKELQQLSEHPYFCPTADFLKKEFKMWIDNFLLSVNYHSNKVKEILEKEGV